MYSGHMLVQQTSAHSLRTIGRTKSPVVHLASDEGGLSGISQQGHLFSLRVRIRTLPQDGKPRDRRLFYSTSAQTLPAAQNRVLTDTRHSPHVVQHYSVAHHGPGSASRLLQALHARSLCRFARAGHRRDRSRGDHSICIDTHWDHGLAARALVLQR